MGKLDALPKELLAHIATVAEPTSVLRLSATCRAIRIACWDPLVLKENLIKSQQDFWNSDSLMLKDIAHTAQADVTIWAKYCVADERTKSLIIDNPEARMEPGEYLRYLPELFVAKHPFYVHERWKAALSYNRYHSPRQAFGLVMGTLSTDEVIPPMSRSLEFEMSQGGINNSGTGGEVLMVLCKTILAIRSGLRTREQAWPYTHAAIKPDIKLPTADQIPLYLLSDDYNLPAPFFPRSKDLPGEPTLSFSAWDSWYRLHNQRFLLTTDTLTQGRWCGYYTSFTSTLLDPPMTNIQYQSADTAPIDTAEESDLHDTQPRKINATDCIDGIDSFVLETMVSCSTEVVNITARKSYVNRGHVWDWDCRLTPFGIVGYWGEREIGSGPFERRGMVWLWREEWTQEA